jgi:hypothetical protein
VDFLEESRKLQVGFTQGKVNFLLDSLKDEDKQSLIDALNDLTISSRSLSKILISHGYKIGRSAVDAWRHENVPGYETRSTHYMGINK